MRGSIGSQFRGLFTKICISSAVLQEKARSTVDWSAQQSPSAAVAPCYWTSSLTLTPTSCSPRMRRCFTSLRQSTRRAIKCTSRAMSTSMKSLLNGFCVLGQLFPSRWWFQFSADRTNGRAIATLLRLSSSSSVVCQSVCDVLYCG